MVIDGQRGYPHLLVAGLPGMGKTTCLLNLCKQMLDVMFNRLSFRIIRILMSGWNA